MDPDHFFKIYGIFLTKKIIFKFFVLFVSLIFILKLDEPFRNEEIFIISLFFKSSELIRILGNPNSTVMYIHYSFIQNRMTFKIFQIIIFYYFSLNLMLLLRTKNVKMQFQVGKISFSGKWWIGLLKFWTVFHF